MAYAVLAFLGSIAILQGWFVLLTVVGHSRCPAINRWYGAVRMSGLWYDIIWNWLVASVLFLEFPREFTFSRRLKRHVEGYGWRHALAIGVCRVFIWPVDPQHLEGEFL